MNNAHSILATLAFFRLFGRPLSRPELQRWLWGHGRLTAEMPRQVTERNGYLYLPGDYPDREQQERVNRALHEKCRKYLPMLRHIPGIRFCGVGNTLAFDAATEDSDIDLFIIARKDMLWWVRWWVTALLHLRGVRRHGKKVAGRFCLSFFVDESAMDLSKVAIEDDVYLRYWIATLQPIFGRQTFRRFRDANAPFVLSKIPYAFVESPTPPDGGNVLLEKLLLSIGRPLLWMTRWVQRQKMRHLPVKLGPGAYVVVNDHMLKFHNNDRRLSFRDKWRSALERERS